MMAKSFKMVGISERDFINILKKNKISVIPEYGLFTNGNYIDYKNIRLSIKEKNGYVKELRTKAPDYFIYIYLFVISFYIYLKLKKPVFFIQNSSIFTIFLFLLLGLSALLLILYKPIVSMYYEADYGELRRKIAEVLIAYVKERDGVDNEPASN